MPASTSTLKLVEASAPAAAPAMTAEDLVRYETKALRAELLDSSHRLAALKNRLPPQLQSLVTTELAEAWSSKFQNLEALEDIPSSNKSAAARKYREMRQALLACEESRQFTEAAQHRAFYSALRSVLMDCVAMRDQDKQSLNIASAYKWFKKHAPRTRAHSRDEAAVATASLSLPAARMAAAAAMPRPSTESAKGIAALLTTVDKHSLGHLYSGKRPAQGVHGGTTKFWDQLSAADQTIAAEMAPSLHVKDEEAKVVDKKYGTPGVLPALQLSSFLQRRLALSKHPDVALDDDEDTAASARKDPFPLSTREGPSKQDIGRVRDSVRSGRRRGAICAANIDQDALSLKQASETMARMRKHRFDSNYAQTRFFEDVHAHVLCWARERACLEEKITQRLETSRYVDEHKRAIVERIREPHLAAAFVQVLALQPGSDEGQSLNNAASYPYPKPVVVTPPQKAKKKSKKEVTVALKTPRAMPTVPPQEDMASPYAQAQLNLLGRLPRPSRNEQLEYGARVLHKLTEIGLPVTGEVIEKVLVQPEAIAFDKAMTKLPRPGSHLPSNKPLEGANVKGAGKGAKKKRKKSKKG